MMSTLLKFMDQLITMNGGDVEWNPGGNGFQALLPDELQGKLSLPDRTPEDRTPEDRTPEDRTPEDRLISMHAGMAADEEPGSLLVGYGTEVLEQAVSLALEGGRTAAVRMPTPASRRDIREELGRQFLALNVTFRQEEVSQGWQDYWLWSFATVLEADERHEGVCHVCISSDGVECPELFALIHDQAAGWKALEPGVGERPGKGLQSVSVIAIHRALEMLGKNTEFTDGVARRHGRDRRRIKDYFKRLDREIEDEIKRRGLTGEALQIKREKQAQLSSEAARKQASLEEKYLVRLTLRPSALLLARLPVNRLTVLVKRRKGERRINVFYNLLSRRFDPLACAACGAATHELGFCDQELHLLCAACLGQSSGQGRRDCPRCQGKCPPANTKQVLERLGLSL